MIKLVNVSKYYSANGTVALGLRKANLELHVNEFVAVVGESGSGKTTLLNVISGIDSYEEGEMYINGEETSYFSTADLENYRKKYIAFVFQNYNLVDSFTVMQNVELPLLLSGVESKTAKKRALEIIKRVGLEKHVHHKATRLSGGQKQRVVIARALAKDCPIIAADEPTGNLDSDSARQIIELLHEISKDKLVIIVTHDFDQVKEFATRKIRIYDGEIVEDLEVKKTNKQNLPLIPEESKQIRTSEHIKMALKTLFSVPKKTVLMILVFFIFAFLVGLVYGAYNLVMIEGGFDYGDSYFSNESVSRIIVQKIDGTAFSTDEIAQIEDMNLVKTVVQEDYLLDANIYLESIEPIEELNNRYNYLYGPTYLPMSVIDRDELLTAGVMPSEDDEVLLVLPSAVLEDEANQALYLDRTYRDQHSDPYGGSRTYDIVGLVSASDLFMNEGYYFVVSDEVYQSLAEEVFVSNYLKGYFTPVEISDRNRIQLYYWGGRPFIDVDDTLQDDEAIFITDMIYEICGYSEVPCESVDGIMEIEDAYVDNVFADMSITFEDDSISFVKVNQHNYDLIVYEDTYQISVITNTDINVSRLVSDLANTKTGGVLKYRVVHPYSFESENEYEQEARFLAGLGIISILIATILGSTLLSYIIFRTIINTKLRDYAILRTVGANQKMIRLLIYFENAIVVSISFVMFAILTIVFSQIESIGPNSFWYALKTFGIMDYLVLLVILLVMSILISGRYCGRVFRDTVQTSLKAE